jgi:hypothetical protein
MVENILNQYAFLASTDFLVNKYSSFLPKEKSKDKNYKACIDGG